jgi:hypothetical protein
MENHRERRKGKELDRSDQESKEGQMEKKHHNR